MDESNRTLIENAHPSDWKNPTPSEKYNLVVIGAGTAGLVASTMAAGLGAKVALIERELMGGDCLNVGCVPSKALIRCAREVAAVKGAGDYGVKINGQAEVDFPFVMERMRRLRSKISEVDSAKEYSAKGVDVYLGKARFLDQETVAVDDTKLQFAKAVICTGGRAFAPDIPGLDKVSFLTSETLFNLTELPTKMVIVGGGPIGCEMAQTFAAFGSQVFLIERSQQILGNDDAEAAELVRKSLEATGVQILFNATDLEFFDGPRFSVKSDAGNFERESIDQVLVAAGRTPNIESLLLEAAGVKSNKHGIEIDDKFQTSNSDVFAAGDVCSKYKFTHAADFMARAVVRNALFFGREKLSALTIPWCTYTTPELAHVGFNPKNARGDGVKIDTYIVSFGEVDRAILDGETEGFVKIHTVQGSDEILGATIVARNAGDLISQISQAMTHGISLGALGKVIFPYPTQAEAIRKLADQFNLEKYSGATTKKVLKKFAELRR